MKRLAILIALSLSACTGIADTIAPSPAPLQATVIDEKALIVAWEGFDIVLYAVDALVANKVLVAGTPKALAVKRYLTATQEALNAASQAQRAGSATNYLEALTRAKDALAGARRALQS